MSHKWLICIEHATKYFRLFLSPETEGNVAVVHVFVCVVPGNTRCKLQEIIDLLPIGSVFKIPTFHLSYHKLFSVEQHLRTDRAVHVSFLLSLCFLMFSILQLFTFFLPSSVCHLPLRLLRNSLNFYYFSKLRSFPPPPFPFPLFHSSTSALPSHTETGPGWREAEEWGGRDRREATDGKWNKWNKMFSTAGWSNCQKMSSGWNCPYSL